MNYPRDFQRGNRTLLSFLLPSLLIALCGFAPPWHFDGHKAIPFFLWMDNTWAAVFIISVFFLRRRALWLLVALPFVLFWVPAVLFFGCAWGPYACV
jgi:hypothetical protein